MNNQLCDEKSISKILNFIIELQKKAECVNLDSAGCDKKYLGTNLNNGMIFNTRPITIYSCCNGTLWEMPYSLNGTDGTSTVFKISKTSNNCATFEVLAPNPDTTNSLIPYVSTNNYFTIDLDCVLAIRCLNDTYTN